MTICTRPGCGTDFDPSSVQSRSGPCFHHPGNPIFHEGSKSWSCCQEKNKPVLEFDEFMLIKGCTESEEHTNVKQPKANFAKTSSATTTTDQAENLVDESSSSNSTPAIENTNASTSLKPMSNARLNAIQQLQKTDRGSSPSPSEKSEQEEEQDPAEADEGSIEKGIQCKRKGCKVKFEGGKRDRTQEHCSFHSGQAIFHEGSKGYSCCKRRVLEFDEFLQIEPCTQAKFGHLFIGGGGEQSTKSNNGLQEIPTDCRIDHYETPSDVRVTVYAKGIEMEDSKILIEEESVTFSLSLPPLPSSTQKRRFDRILKPFSTIDAKASSFNVTKFKVDLTLIKQAKGESWPTLERGDQPLGYGLTFGRKLDA